MTNYAILLLLCAAPVFLLFCFAVVLPRFRMERRARALLAQHPNAERTSVFLPLHSTFAAQKQREIDAKIAEMNSEGWTFLRISEANPLRTLRFWGGGVTLHFIR